MPVISASFESFVFLSVFRLTKFTCSSSNSVGLIKSFNFIFIELKVKGVVCVSFSSFFFFFFANLKLARNSQSQKSSLLNRPC